MEISHSSESVVIQLHCEINCARHAGIRQANSLFSFALSLSLHCVFVVGFDQFLMRVPIGKSKVEVRASALN